MNAQRFRYSGNSPVTKVRHRRPLPDRAEKAMRRDDSRRRLDIFAIASEIALAQAEMIKRGGL